MKATNSKHHVEILTARKYYGPHASGHVVLVNGQPHHCTGATSKADAEKYAARFTTPARRGITTGTAHFESRAAAVEYYRPYLGEPQGVILRGDVLRWPSSKEYIRCCHKDDEAARMVDAKLAAGEIFIGPPALKAGQTLSLNREEGRYFITE